MPRPNIRRGSLYGFARLLGPSADTVSSWAMLSQSQEQESNLIPASRPRPRSCRPISQTSLATRSPIVLPLASWETTSATPLRSLLLRTSRKPSNLRGITIFASSSGTLVTSKLDSPSNLACGNIQLTGVYLVTLVDQPVQERWLHGRTSSRRSP